VYPNIYKIDKDIIYIGRSPSSDIVINDKKSSRSHARIIYINGLYMVEDLNSKNGTYVNGSKISGTRHINPGDIIKIGSSEFTFNTDVQSRRVISKNKLLLIVAIIVVAVVLAVTIPTVLYVNKESYKTVDRFYGGEKVYSYSIPESYTAFFDYGWEVEYFYNSSKTKLCSFSLEWSDRKVTNNDLISNVEYLEEELEYYDEYTGILVKLKERKDEWFYSNNPKINAYVVEYDAITSLPDISDIYFWEFEDTLIYVVFMSISGKDEYLGYLTLFDISIDRRGDKNIVNNFIDSLVMDI